MSGRSVSPDDVLADAAALRAERLALCGELGHPGVTYNPWQGRTWCLCGEVIRDGDAATHAACCGGPLDARRAS